LALSKLNIAVLPQRVPISIGATLARLFACELLVALRQELQ
jgi:hypothetical protein